MISKASRGVVVSVADRGRSSEVRISAEMPRISGDFEQCLGAEAEKQNVHQFLCFAGPSKVGADA
jgi:hypothetical protein